eukprot:m.25726 g.25726  ORF g.25726 m.25726 type:complete len:227 (-) comp11415_c0_seq1:126-806(-)
MSYKISPAEHESVEQLRAAAGAHKIHPDLLATKRLFQVLCVAKWNQPKALARLQRFSELYEELELHDLDPEGSIKQEFENRVFFVPPADSHRGILGFRLRFYNPEEHDRTTMARALAHACFTLLEHEEVAREGVILLGVGMGAGWKNFSKDTEKLMLRCIQDSIPLRLPQLMVVEPPFFFSVVLTIMRPFLSSKLRQRLRKVNRTELVQVVPHHRLPSDLLPDADA